MSDPNVPVPPPLPPSFPPPPQPKNRGLGWFFAVSGAIVLLLTLGCIVAIAWDDKDGETLGLGILCGSPTLILGAVFLWLGSRRLKR